MEREEKAEIVILHNLTVLFRELAGSIITYQRVISHPEKCLQEIVTSVQSQGGYLRLPLLANDFNDKYLRYQFTLFSKTDPTDLS